MTTTSTSLSLDSPSTLQRSSLDEVEEPQCSGCNQIIEEGSVVAFGERIYHVDCFRCARCQNVVNHDSNLLLLNDGNPVCDNCSYNCRICKQKIEDLAIMTGDESYHSDCFRCRLCKRKIEDLVFAKTSQGVYCIPCHTERLEKGRKKQQHQKKSLEKTLPSLPDLNFGRDGNGGSSKNIAKSQALARGTPLSTSGKWREIKQTLQGAGHKPLASSRATNKLQRHPPPSSSSINSPIASQIAPDRPERPDRSYSTPEPVSSSNKTSVDLARNNINGESYPPQSPGYNTAPLNIAKDSNANEINSNTSTPNGDLSKTNGTQTLVRKRSIKELGMSLVRRRSTKESTPVNHARQPSSTTMGNFPGPLRPEDVPHPQLDRLTGLTPLQGLNIPMPLQQQQPQQSQQSHPSQSMHSSQNPLTRQRKRASSFSMSSIRYDDPKNFDTFTEFHANESNGLPALITSSHNLNLEDDLAKIFKDYGAVVSPPHSPMLRPTNSLNRRASKLRRSLSEISSPLAQMSSSWSNRGSGRKSRSVSSLLPIIPKEPPSVEVINETLKSELRRSANKIVELESKLTLSEPVDEEGQVEDQTAIINGLQTQKEVLLQEIAVLRRIKEDAESEESDTQLRDKFVADLRSSLSSVVASYESSINLLITKKNTLTKENTQLVLLKNQALEESLHLNSKNAELIQMNNDQIRTLQERNTKPYKHKEGLFNLSFSNKAMPPPPPKESPLNSPDTSLDRRLPEFPSDDTLTANSVISDQKRNNISDDVASRRGFKWKNVGQKSKHKKWNISEPINEMPVNVKKPSTTSEAISFRNHTFHVTKFLKPCKCDRCLDKIWGSEVRCIACGYVCHSKCINQVAITCGEARPSRENDAASISSADNNAPALFGNDLTAQLDYEGRSIPYIMVKCIAEVELRGMDVEGIYRKSGGASQLRLITELFENGGEVDLSIDGGVTDITAVTSAFKKYLRALPNPLTTKALYSKFVEVNTIEGLSKQIEHVKRTVAELPKAYYDCLEYLINHLLKVIQSSDENKMTAKNLAVVFAPTLLRGDDQDGLQEITDIHKRNQCMDILLTHATTIFA